MKKIITIAINLLLLSSCAAIKDLKDAKLDSDAVHKRAIEQFDERSIVRVTVPREAFAIKEYARIDKDIPVDVYFDKCPFDTLLMSVAKKYNLNVIFGLDTEAAVSTAIQQPSAVPGQVQSPAQAPGLRKEISINFRGPLKDLIANLSKASGYFLTVENGSIIVTRMKTINVLVPNYDGLQKEIQANLEALGARDVAYDTLTSTVSCKVDSVALERARDYFTKLRDNAALVTMRIVLLDVKLTGNENYGIDWTSVVAGYKSQKQTPLGINSINNNSSNTSINASSSNTTSTSNSSTSTSTQQTGTTVANALKDGAGAVFASTGANLFLENRTFSLASFIDLIEQYGKSSTLENTWVASLSGKKGKFETLTKTPYIQNIGVAAIGNTGTTTTQSTANTAIANQGVSIEMLPYYNRQGGTLGMDLKVSVYGMPRFITLSAGNLGTFTSAEENTQRVETYLRMKPDQVAVIASLNAVQENNNTSGLPVDTLLTKKITKSQTKEQLVIVVKPLVIEFVPE